METLVLHAKKRDRKSRALETARSQGLVPAITYGKEAGSDTIFLDSIELERVYRYAGENTLVDMDLDGEKKKVLIYEAQHNVKTGKITHVDLFQVRMTETLETEVPLVFVGESEAVKNLMGVFITNKHEVLIKCLPADLPHEISVDVSTLKTFDDIIFIKDLVLPRGVEVIADPEEAVALVNPPRSDEEMAELETKPVEAVDQVEVAQKAESEAPGETGKTEAS